MLSRLTGFFLAYFVALSVLYGQEVYCRYEWQGSAHFGKVVGEEVLELDRAPWDGGQPTGRRLPLSDVRLLHPSEPNVIIGLSGAFAVNWEGKTAPRSVRWFVKPASSAASPGDDIVLPASLDEVVVEAEIVLVIGKTVKDATPEEAKEAIFGYTVGNDVCGSVESYHRVQGDPPDMEETVLQTGLKIGDRFAPYGPFIYRGLEWRNRKRRLVVENPAAGKRLVHEHAEKLLYPPEKIVSDLSKVLTLRPGDVIFTGAMKALPARAGDLVTVEVEELGKITNRIVAPTK